VLFTTYSPDGVGEEDLASHLQGLEELVRIDSPQASTLLLTLGRPSQAR
jgi:hypothetical protein